MKRNVVELTEVPTGQPGRRSKSLSSQQADDVLTKAAPDRLHAYIVVSLLTGARTEELRAGLGACPPRPGLRTAVPRSMAIGASSRRYQDPKVASHPSLGQSLCRRASRPASAAGSCSPPGSALAWTRDLRRALALVPGLNPADWTPRELRHSFVSLLSFAGVPLQDIAQLVGHSGTTVTELVYRHQIRPVIQAGATVMDRLFGHGGSGA